MTDNLPFTNGLCHFTVCFLDSSTDSSHSVFIEFRALTKQPTSMDIQTGIEWGKIWESERERERENKIAREMVNKTRAKCLENIYLLHWTKFQKQWQYQKTPSRKNVLCKSYTESERISVPLACVQLSSQKHSAPNVISRLIEIQLMDGCVRLMLSAIQHRNLLNIRYWSHLKRHRLMNNNLLSITLVLLCILDLSCCPIDGIPYSHNSPHQKCN